MSGRYRIHLTSGAVLEGDDERETLELVQAIDDTRQGKKVNQGMAGDDLPWGWTWLAGFYLREEHVAAVEYVPPPPRPEDRPTAPNPSRPSIRP